MAVAMHEPVAVAHDQAIGIEMAFGGRLFCSLKVVQLKSLVALHCLQDVLPYRFVYGDDWLAGETDSFGQFFKRVHVLVLEDAQDALKGRVHEIAQRCSLVLGNKLADDLDSLEKRAKDNSTWRKSGWEDIRYGEIRDAMVTYLLPINGSLLDLPVQNRYQKAFDFLWGKLEGRDEQTSVAEQTATVEKKKPSDFLEQP